MHKQFVASAQPNQAAGVHTCSCWTAARLICGRACSCSKGAVHRQLHHADLDHVLSAVQHGGRHDRCSGVWQAGQAAVRQLEGGWSSAWRSCAAATACLNTPCCAEQPRHAVGQCQRVGLPRGHNQRGPALPEVHFPAPMALWIRAARCGCCPGASCGSSLMQQQLTWAPLCLQTPSWCSWSRKSTSSPAAKKVRAAAKALHSLSTSLPAAWTPCCRNVLCPCCSSLLPLTAVRAACCQHAISPMHAG